MLSPCPPKPQEAAETVRLVEYRAAVFPVEAAHRWTDGRAVPPFRAPADPEYLIEMAREGCEESRRVGLAVLCPAGVLAIREGLDWRTARETWHELNRWFRERTGECFADWMRHAIGSAERMTMLGHLREWLAHEYYGVPRDVNNPGGAPPA